MRVFKIFPQSLLFFFKKFLIIIIFLILTAFGSSLQWTGFCCCKAQALECVGSVAAAGKHPTPFAYHMSEENNVSKFPTEKKYTPRIDITEVSHLSAHLFVRVDNYVHFFFKKKKEKTMDSLILKI